MHVPTFETSVRPLQPFLLAALAAGVLQWAGGCAAPMPVRPLHYDIHVSLDPVSNSLRGETALHLARAEDGPPPGGSVVVALELNPALTVTAVDCDSAVIKSHTTKPKEIAKPEEHEGFIPTVHHLTLDKPADDFTITVKYAGTLYQDPSAGEKRGEIHNFTMSAHVGTNGIYLSESGGWYPVPVFGDDAPPENTLADCSLVVDSVAGVEFAAGLESEPDSAGDGTLRWSSAFPLTGVVLTGGDRVRLTTEHGGIRIHALVSRGKEALGEDLLDCARQCYDRYVPLLGPYPFEEFSILESFFSSGFAFPGFTQLAPVIINPKKPYWRHGYIDHEFVHNWFGNGIYVDPNDGNWCEALTSYCTNLFGYELDGDTVGARRKRRNDCHFLSRLKPEKDKPLGTFGLEDGAGRSIGYSKGSMVFQMLAFTIGQDAFWAGLKRFTAERMGKFTNWDDIQACFAAETGRDLDLFFEQWVRSAGTPQLEILSASHDAAAKALELTVTQGETEFALDVPIRIYRDEQSYRDVLVPITSSEEVVRLPAATAPVFVELDPDYHVFRKVPADQILPTSSLTRHGKKLVIVKPEGEIWSNYELVASDFEEGNGADNTTTIVAPDLTLEALEETGVLVLGAAVRRPEVQDLLARAGCPVSWQDSGFCVGEKTYDRPGQAVFVTMHYPGDPKRGITVYYGNDERALANAGILGYYSNSLLVFGTVGDVARGMGMSGGSRVLYREDLETPARVNVLCK